MSLLFIDRLDAYRTLIGSPMVIASGWRCMNHPDERDKAFPGTHTEGIAADVAAAFPISGRILLLALIDPEMTGHGVDLPKGRGFIHLDMGLTQPGRKRPYFWTYR